jgi:cytochrome c553
MRHVKSYAVASGALVWLLLLAPQPRALADAATPPAWAYPVNPPVMPPGLTGDAPVQVPHSDRSFRLSQLTDRLNAPDWHPEDHPAMPEVVARGRGPMVFACAYCHLPDGAGRPENASLAGLPVDYIVQQLTEMKAGARRTAVPERAPPQLMFTLAGSMTDAEIRAAADYFASLQPRYRMRVIETDTVPHTHVAGWFLAADSDAPREPIGRRIIEVPENLDQFEYRDARVRILVYVPPGSVKAGAALIKTGGANRTLACAGCHGADLKGVGAVPGIAGRSPSYIVRQLFDIQTGARSGPAVAPMQDVVRHLDLDDMVGIAARLATLH